MNRQKEHANHNLEVNRVFDQVSKRYDLMNDLMSLGTHRILKRIFCESTSVHEGDDVLDVAGGTGDIAKLLVESVGDTGSVTVLDVNERMTVEGRDRLIEAGYAEVQFVVANVEAMPLPDHSYDCISMAFGIRNVADKQAALAECYRVLKAQGRLSILEFAHPTSPGLNSAFHSYRRLWPLLGSAVVGDTKPYEYLVSSIDTHTTQDELKALVEYAGFHYSQYDNLLGGIVAIHTGVK